MQANQVLITHLDGAYSLREYPTAETARWHAAQACQQNPTATVQCGGTVLQVGSVDSDCFQR